MSDEHVGKRLGECSLMKENFGGDFRHDAGSAFSEKT